MEQTLDDLHLKKGQLHTDKEILEAKLRNITDVQLIEINSKIIEHVNAANKKEKEPPIPEETPVIIEDDNAQSLHGVPCKDGKG